MSRRSARCVQYSKNLPAPSPSGQRKLASSVLSLPNYGEPEPSFSIQNSGMPSSPPPRVPYNDSLPRSKVPKNEYDISFMIFSLYQNAPPLVVARMVLPIREKIIMFFVLVLVLVIGFLVCSSCSSHPKTVKSTTFLSIYSFSFVMSLRLRVKT